MQHYMKRACIILMLILAISPKVLIAQSQNSFIEYADFLFEKKKYKPALKEYLRAYYYDRNNEHTGLSLQIANCFSKNGDLKNSIIFYDQYLRLDQLKPIEKSIAHYAKIQEFLQSHLYAKAQFALYSIPDEIINLNQNKYAYYSGIIHALTNNISEAISSFEKLDYVNNQNELVQILNDIERIHNKNHNTSRILSTVLPGLGQTVNGEFKDGLNSFIVTGGFLYLFFEVASQLSVVDSLVSVGPWFTRYFVGGLKNAKRASVDHQNRNLHTKILELSRIIQDQKKWNARK